MLVWTFACRELTELNYHTLFVQRSHTEEACGICT